MTTLPTIRHHLNDALLMGYAAGHLSEAFGLVVATHVTMCDDCRARLESFEALGGAVIEAEDETAVSTDALARMMARLEVPVVSAPPKAPRKTSLPSPVAAYVGGDLDAVKWRALGGGVRQAILPTGPKATVRLLHIPAGQAVPDHGHRGMELTLVLRGAFRDATDRFGPGDLEIAGEDLAHKPVAEAGEDCICLAATDAPLRFAGLMPRLLQPLFRI
jgi:putative transcriptional regulator